MTASLRFFFAGALLLLPACQGITVTNQDAGSESDDIGESTGDSTDVGSDATDASETTDTATSDTTTDTGSSTDTTDTGPLDCTGPQGIQPLPADYSQPATPKAPGSTWAYFELVDFQPQSCNFGQSYSLETFKGRVTLVSLMRSTCMICQGTIEKLEQMYQQLSDEGYEVWFVVINQHGYDASQQEFIDRVSFPLLQDRVEVDAWDLMNIPGMGTDDMYIYGADGILHSYFNYAANNPSIDLKTQAGWDTVYNAILDALQG
ncbi:MAG: redoxin domain-containing protein [Myxococcales bacterium]|nr:redoxin domain-containing protein [Myxococcales bacterium]